MPHSRKFRFGVHLTGHGCSRQTWREWAREAESLGYATLSMPDHFGDQLALVPALMAAADVTTRLRIGSLVWDNDYKHPVVLAKEIATLDVLSEGRLELGLGAGWARRDYDRAGLPYDPPGVRIDRMVEGLAVMRGLFAEGSFSFSGKHYHIRDLDGMPKPVQRPGPPVLIGGGGRRVLSLAAQQADIVGVNVDLRAGEIGPETPRNATADATLQKLQWIREAAGSRYPDLEIHVAIYATAVSPHREKAAQAIAEQFGAPVELIMDIPNVLVGSLEQIVEMLQDRRRLYDMSYFSVVGVDAMRAMAPVVEKLAGT